MCWGALAQLTHGPGPAQLTNTICMGLPKRRKSRLEWPPAASAIRLVCGAQGGGTRRVGEQSCMSQERWVGGLQISALRASWPDHSAAHAARLLSCAPGSRSCS